VPVEGDAVHGHASSHLRPYPSVVQLMKGDFSCPMNSIDEPDVLLEDAGGFHNQIYLVF
jgi:hypothetical protein